MGVMVIVAYKPKPGKEADLRAVLKEHLPILRGQNLATERPSLVLRAKDGTMLEIFEWRSLEAINQAHTNAAVLAMWKRFEEACEIRPLSTLEECQGLFAGFEPVTL
jgi:hypothetical protein